MVLFAYLNQPKVHSYIQYTHCVCSDPVHALNRLMLTKLYFWNIIYLLSPTYSDVLSYIYTWAHLALAAQVKAGWTNDPQTCP